MPRGWRMNGATALHSLSSHPTPMRRLSIFRLSALLALLAPAHLRAQATPQTTGRIVGRIVDAATGAGIAEAGVQVVGTTLGTRSGVDGRFTLAAVPAGTVTLKPLTSRGRFGIGFHTAASTPSKIVRSLLWEFAGNRLR